MKSIKLIDGKVYIVKEITVNESLTTTKRSLQFDVEAMIKAVSDRMTKCLNGLMVATEKNLILSKSESVITYIDTQQSVRNFCIHNYQNMEHIIKVLKEFQEQEAAYLPIETVTCIFTAPELGQLKKAMVDYFGRWTDTISALEEIEIFKYVNGQ